MTRVVFLLFAVFPIALTATECSFAQVGPWNGHVRAGAVQHANFRDYPQRRTPDRISRRLPAQIADHHYGTPQSRLESAPFDRTPIPIPAETPEPVFADNLIGSDLSSQHAPQPQWIDAQPHSATPAGQHQYFDQSAGYPQQIWQDQNRHEYDSGRHDHGSPYFELAWPSDSSYSGGSMADGRDGWTESDRLNQQRFPYLTGNIFGVSPADCCDEWNGHCACLELTNARSPCECTNPNRASWRNVGRGHSNRSSCSDCSGNRQTVSEYFHPQD